MQRGEVWWANFPMPRGRRPVVLLTRNEAYSVRSAVTVGPITRTVRDLPVEVSLDHRDGLEVPCVVNLDDIGTIPFAFLDERITTLSAERMREVREAIVFALALAEDEVP